MRLAPTSITLSIALSIAAACRGDGSSLGSATSGDETTAAMASSDDLGPMAEAGGTDASADDDGPSTTAASGAATGDGDGGDSSSGAPAGGTTEGDTSTEPPDGALMYEPFDAPDGTPWTEPWIEMGGLVAHEIVGGRGRLQGQAITVGRMVFPGIDAADVDATATVIFEDFDSQGFGLYVRQNGGYLVHTQPEGQGYALYVEGGYQQLLGVWRERAGVEEIVTGETVPGGALASGAPYRVRFRCTQVGDQTRLQAKIWPAGEDEPEAWFVDALDATPELQGASGTLAVDIYNYQGTASIQVDDITLSPAS